MLFFTLLSTLAQTALPEDLSHLPMEHRGGDVILPESGSGPVALAQRSNFGNNFGNNFKRQTNDDDIWPATQPDLPQIQDIQVQCEKTSIRVNVKFDRPFYGMIFSKGFYSDPNCIHLASGSGTITASFEIFLNSCGMSSSGNTETYGQPNPAGSFVENTIIIQYDALVQEVWDQARKLRCTWYDYYEKSVTFRPFQVDMINAVTANFLGDNLQCWMQIQVGKGPWSSEVSGIVKIGQTMTMVMGIKDDENKFDMLVRNCVAHDGKRAPIQLVDELGCVTRTKIMSKFQKIKNFGSSASVVSYAYFQAFKFPDSMNVHFQCVIQVCRYNCPDPVCGAESQGLDLGAFASNTGASVQPQTPNNNPFNNQRVFSVDNRRHFNVDPRQQVQAPRQVIPAGLVMDEDELDKYTAPAPVSPAKLKEPPVRAQRRHPPPQSKAPGLFSKIPGLSKKLGELLAGRSAKLDQSKRVFKREIAEDKEIITDHAKKRKFGQPVLRRLYKRDAQEMADIEMDGVIQVLSPGDVAFTLGQGNDTTIISNTAEWDPNNICMSLSSLVGGLVLLVGVLLVASMVASVMHCQIRKRRSKKLVK